MHFRKLVSIWGILALLIAQIAVAHHSAVHIDHGLDLQHSTAQQQILETADDHDDAPIASHDCPECLLIKTLQTAYHGGHNALHAPVIKAVSEPPAVNTLHSQTQSRAYNPRAPPAVLI